MYDQKVVYNMLGKERFKKAIGNDKIIGGIVLILFGIGGIIFGVNVYNNQNFVQSCNSISSPLINLMQILDWFVNSLGISILSIVP